MVMAHVSYLPASHSSLHALCVSLPLGHALLACAVCEQMALIMWCYELARRLQGTNITVNATHPGTVNTQLGR